MSDAEEKARQAKAIMACDRAIAAVKTAHKALGKTCAYWATVKAGVALEAVERAKGSVVNHYRSG